MTLSGEVVPLKGRKKRPLATQKQAKQALKLVREPCMPPETARWENIGERHIAEAKERLAAEFPNPKHDFRLLMQSLEELHAWRLRGARDAESDQVMSKLAERLEPELNLVLGPTVRLPLTG